VIITNPNSYINVMVTKSYGMVMAHATEAGQLTIIIGLQQP